MQVNSVFTTVNTDWSYDKSKLKLHWASYLCIEVCRIAAEEVELNIFKFTWLPELLSSLCSGICEQSSNICIICRDSCSVHCWSSRWSTTPADQTFRERGAGRGWRGRGDSGSWRMLTPWILHPTLFQDKTKFHPMRLQCCTWWDTQPRYHHMPAKLFYSLSCLQRTNIFILHSHCTKRTVSSLANRLKSFQDKPAAAAQLHAQVSKTSTFCRMNKH